MNQSTPASLGAQRIALFAAINHLARLSDPRNQHPPEESLKAIRDALELANKADTEFGVELTEWVKSTLNLVGRVNGM